jgi:hypothetical protein
MNTDDSPEGKQLREAMLTMVDRMAVAGWIASSAVTPEGINVVWTDIGSAVVTELHALLAILKFPLSDDEQKCLLYLVAKTRSR